MRETEDRAEDLLRCRVQLCGPFRVAMAGRRVEGDLPGRQGRLVFAYLALHRTRSVGRSRLIDLLWPEGATPGAETTLRGLIFRLRSALGEDVLTGKSELRLTLPEDALVDVESARGGVHEAESAIALGRHKEAWVPARIVTSVAEAGFMPGFEGPWIDSVRDELDELRLRSLECIGEIALALGGAEQAAAERSGRALIASAPFRESGYRLLMRALDADGNPAEALRTFERFRSLCREELGTTPSPRLLELHARIVERPGAGDEPAAPG